MAFRELTADAAGSFGHRTLREVRHTQDDKQINQHNQFQAMAFGHIGGSRGRLMGVLSGSVRREVAPLCL